jgi:hypothetical protein
LNTLHDAGPNGESLGAVVRGMGMLDRVSFAATGAVGLGGGLEPRAVGEAARLAWTTGGIEATPGCVGSTFRASKISGGVGAAATTPA